MKNPDPELTDRIVAELRAMPTISRTALAERVGVSRQTLGYYLRALRTELGEVCEAFEALRVRRATTTLELVEDVGRAAADIEAEVEALRAMPVGERRANAIFRGYGALAAYHRLMAEMLGEIAPPTTNVYLTKVEQLLTVQLPDERLPEDQRGRVESPA